MDHPIEAAVHPHAATAEQAYNDQPTDGESLSFRHYSGIGQGVFPNVTAKK